MFSGMMLKGDSPGSGRLTGKEIRWFCIAVAAVAAVAAALYFIFRKKPQPAPFPTVEVERVTTDDVSVYGDYAGRITALMFVEVRARVEGFLEEMNVAEGSFVKKGQRLFTIDPTLYKANVEKARALLNKARATARRPATTLTAYVRSTSRTRPRALTSTMPWPPMRARKLMWW